MLVTNKEKLELAIFGLHTEINSLVELTGEFNEQDLYMLQQCTNQLNGLIKRQFTALSITDIAKTANHNRSKNAE